MNRLTTTFLNGFYSNELWSHMTDMWPGRLRHLKNLHCSVKRCWDKLPGERGERTDTFVCVSVQERGGEEREREREEKREREREIGNSYCITEYVVSLKATDRLLETTRRTQHAALKLHDRMFWTIPPQYCLMTTAELSVQYIILPNQFLSYATRKSITQHLKAIRL